MSIRVDVGEVMNLSADCGRQAAQIEGALAALLSRVGQVRGAGWQGTASDAFEGLYQEWNASARRLHEALVGISQLLARSAQNYDATERANTASLAGR